MWLHHAASASNVQHDIITFSEWLLHIGNGTIGSPDEDDRENTSWVKIPAEYCIDDTETGLTELIQFIYDAEMLQSPTTESLQQKAIVCLKNETVDMINKKILETLHGHVNLYRSFD